MEQCSVTYLFDTNKTVPNVIKRREMYRMNKKAIGAVSLALVISLLVLGSAVLVARAFLPEDVNQDGKVDMKDISVAIAAFNTSPGSPRYNPNADVNNDSRIDMRDIVQIALNFGK
jgi:Dockerin type I domain